MKICIINAAEEPVEFREGTILEDLLANIPPGHSWIEVAPPAQTNETGEPIPPLNPERTKIAVFNANGFPIQVFEGTLAACAERIVALPPTQKALTLKGTQWENVEMPGDLLSYAEMLASLTPDEEA